MEKELQKQKKTEKIDFIKAKTKEFILYDFESKKFSIIFYDNKYREDTYKLNTEKYIYEIELKGDIYKLLDSRIIKIENKNEKEINSYLIDLTCEIFKIIEEHYGKN